MVFNWLAFLILIVLYFGFATRALVKSSRRFYDNKQHGVLLALMLLIPFVLVALPNGRSNPASFLTDLLRMAAYLLVPSLLLVNRPTRAKSLHLVDVLAILAIWFPIELGWLPDVEAHLTEGVSIPIPLLTGVVLLLICFLVLRPLSGIGYRFWLNGRDLKASGQALLLYILIGFPIAVVTGFIVLRTPSIDLGGWVMSWFLGYLFTALPEELLFRGVIQNQLHDRIKNEWVALAVGSVIFGLAHVNNSTAGFPVPNWMYVIMATLAGLAYGWTWRKTGKVTAAALVHASVNLIWSVVAL